MTDYKTVFIFLKTIHDMPILNLKQEANSVLKAMKKYRYTAPHPTIDELDALALADMIKQAERILRHPNASTDARIYSILTDMEELFQS